MAKSGAVTRGGYEAWAGSKGRGAKSERKKLRCETKRLMRKRMRNQKNSDEKRCDAKQLMRKNDAKYAKKIFLSFAKKMRNSCETDPVLHQFRIHANFFLRNRRTLIQNLPLSFFAFGWGGGWMGRANSDDDIKV